MERCVDCNTLLTRSEKVCVECGTKVNQSSTGIADLVAGMAKIAFYISLLVLIASPFVDRLPSFMFCMLATCALLFFMRTAKDHSQKVKKR